MGQSLVKINTHIIFSTKNTTELTTPEVEKELYTIYMEYAVN